MSLREEVARAMTATLSAPWEDVCEEDRAGLLLYADAAIAIVLERAAEVADGFYEKWSNAGGFEGQSAGARVITQAIRALGDEQ